MRDDARTHQEIWALLPWLANGRATLAQRQHAEAHLSHCADCRAELEREQQIVQALTQPAAATLDPERGLHRLLQRLDQAQDVAPRAGFWQVLAGARLGLGAVAALGLAELLLGSVLALWWLQSRAPLAAADAAPYRTLALPDPAAATGTRWRVVFQEQRTLQELQALLRAQGLTVVAGPSEAGVFTLAADAAQRSAAEPDAVAARLRESALVRFAEAVPERARP
jgi:hypothetical protein